MEARPERGIIGVLARQLKVAISRAQNRKENLNAEYFGLGTLGDIVEANGAKAPSRVVLTYQGRDYSYSEHRSRICRGYIVSYKKPKSVVFDNALPRLPNKKIDKKQYVRRSGKAARWFSISQEQTAAGRSQPPILNSTFAVAASLDAEGPNYFFLVFFAFFFIFFVFFATV